MPKYKAIYTEYHRVSVTFSDEFDTADKDKWEWLKSSVESEMEPDDFDALPIKPPKDPQIWFSLYQQLSEMEYEEKEDDWITLRKGGYDTSRELLDAKGKVIASE
jgi:hypothetical protein